MFIGQVPTLSLDETSITASNVRINIMYRSSSNREGSDRGRILGRPSFLVFARKAIKNVRTVGLQECGLFFWQVYCCTIASSPLRLNAFANHLIRLKKMNFFLNIIYLFIHSLPAVIWHYFSVSLYVFVTENIQSAGISEGNLYFCSL